MSLVTIILVLLVVGIVMWIINGVLVLPPPLKTVINVAIAVLLLLWVVYVLFPGVAGVRIGR